MARHRASRQDFRSDFSAGIRNIVEKAARAGVKRFVQCSTVGVHGGIEKPPADEDAPIEPDDYYQETTRKQRRLARAEAEEYPDDERNREAATDSLRLRKEVDALPAAAFEGIVSYINSSDEAFHSWCAVEAEEIKGHRVPLFPG